jgi:SAM-dependent methyltransferase
MAHESRLLEWDSSGEAMQRANAALAAAATLSEHPSARPLALPAAPPATLPAEPWIRRFCALLPAKARVLEVGCGPSPRFALAMRRDGYPVLGLDRDARVIADLRRRHPTGDWWTADPCRLDLPARFDGIVGWDCYSTLTADEQRAALPCLASHLRTRGVLLLAVAHDPRRNAPRVGPALVPPSGLSCEECVSILADFGVDLVRFTRLDPGCGRYTVLLARRATRTATRRVVTLP